MPPGRTVLQGARKIRRRPSGAGMRADAGNRPRRAHRRERL